MWSLNESVHNSIRYVCGRSEDRPQGIQDAHYRKCENDDGSLGVSKRLKWARLTLWRPNSKAIRCWIRSCRSTHRIRSPSLFRVSFGMSRERSLHNSFVLRGILYPQLWRLLSARIPTGYSSSRVAMVYVLRGEELL